MTRATNLQIWKFIADGILRDNDISYEQAIAFEFIEKVAKKLLDVDSSDPNLRAERIMNAVGLSSRLDPNEHHKRYAIEIVEDFCSELSKKEQMQIILQLYRERMGLPGYLDEATDNERIRQINSFRKKDKHKK